MYVGLPLHLSGAGGTGRGGRPGLGAAPGGTDRRCPIRLIDERLSTVQAQRGLQRPGRTTRQSRSVIDSASAVIVLQAALDQEQATEAVPGREVRSGRAGRTGHESARAVHDVQPAAAVAATGAPGASSLAAIIALGLFLGMIASAFFLLRGSTDTTDYAGAGTGEAVVVVGARRHPHRDRRRSCRTPESC